MSPTLRRALVPLLVAAAVLGIVGTVLAVAQPWNGSTTLTAPGGGGSDGSTGSGAIAAPSATPSDDQAPGRPGDPRGRFTAVRLAADGTSLDVTFWGGVDTCYRYEVRADEDEQAVVLSLAEDRRTDGPCIDLAQEYRRTVRLGEPLGDRVLRDGETGTALDPIG